jgi:hypothetical protein
MKIPPNPPKRLTKKDIGGSSARILPQDDKKSTTGRPTRNGKRKPRSVGGASIGFSSSEQPSPAEQRNQFLLLPYKGEDGKLEIRIV